MPAKDLPLKVVVDRLRMGEAEIRGLHVWEAGAKVVAVAPRAPLPKGCVAEVRGILTATDFNVEEEAR